MHSKQTPAYSPDAKDGDSDRDGEFNYYHDGLEWFRCQGCSAMPDLRKRGQ